MQIIIKLIFNLLNFGHIQEYFKSKHNFLTEEEEMKYEYDRGYLTLDDRKYYEDNFLNKDENNANPKLAESKVDDSDGLLTDDSCMDSSSDGDEHAKADISNARLIQNESILQKYFHPVETFMLENMDFFHEDYNNRVIQMVETCD